MVLPRLEGIILARWLGPGGFGAAQLLVYLSSMLEIVCRSAPAAAVAYHVARACPMKPVSDGFKKWRLFCLAGISAGILGSMFFSEYTAGFSGGALLLAVTGIVMLREPWYSGWLAGNLALRESARARMTASVGRLAVLIIMLAAGAGYLAAQLAIIFSALVSAWLFKKAWKGRDMDRAERQIAVVPGDMLRFSGGKAMGMLAMLLMARNSLILVQWLGPGSKETGLFAAALTLSSVIIYSWNLSSAWIMPGFINCVRLGDNAAFRAHLKRSFFTLCCITLPPLAVIAVYSAPILRLLFGSQYAQAARPASLLAAGAFLFILYQFFAASILGRPWKTALLHWSCVVLQAGLCALFIPARGIEGAALACLISWGAALAAAGIWAARNAGRDPTMVNSRGAVYAEG